MTQLIGWPESVSSITDEILNDLNSYRPFRLFSITGERRSGRSTFFKEICKQIDSNGSDSDICFVGQLEEATPEGLVSVLLQVVTDHPDIQIDPEVLKTALFFPRLDVDGFFKLVGEIISCEKRPIFLIDMGECLEQALKDQKIDAILQLARYLKLIENKKVDKNLPFIFGCGWTWKFTSYARNLAGDVFIDRFRSLRTLGNSFETENPFSAFQEIVKNISNVEIPDRFMGLLRVPGITAGMYGENLKTLGVANIATEEEVWQALHGQWQIIENLFLGDLDRLFARDLAILLLADETTNQNNYPDLLELSQNQEFQAKEELYKKFGLIHPRRDPTLSERLQNRLNDLDDNKLLEEFLGSVKSYLEGYCDAKEITDKFFDKRTGVVSAILSKFPENIDNQVDTISHELNQHILPARITIGIYLDDVNVEEFENTLKGSMQDDQFVIVLYPEGKLPIENTPFGRNISSKKYKWSTSQLNKDQLISLITSNLEDPVTYQNISLVIYDGILKHLTAKPPLPLMQTQIRKVFSTLIASGGKISLEKIKTLNSFTKTDVLTISNKLSRANIAQKKKEYLFWDPVSDKVLQILHPLEITEEEVETDPDSKNYVEKLQEEYTLPIDGFDITNIAQCYSGIFDESPIDEFSDEQIINWYTSHKSQLIAKLNDLITQDSVLRDYSNKVVALGEETIESIEDISNDRERVEELEVEINDYLERIKTEKKLEVERLDGKKEKIRGLLIENDKYFLEDEKTEFYSQLDRVISSNSKKFNEINNQITRRVKGYKTYENKIVTLNKTIDKCSNFLNAQNIEKYEDALNNIRTILTSLQFGNIDTPLKKLTEGLSDIEREHTRKKLLGGSKKTTTIPSSPGSEPSLPSVAPPTSGSEPSLPSVAPPTSSGEPTVPPVAPPTSSGEPTVATVVGTIQGTEGIEPARSPIGGAQPPATSNKKEKAFDLSSTEDIHELVQLLTEKRDKIEKIHAEFSEE